MGQYNSSDSEEEQKKQQRGKNRKQQASQPREAITQTEYFKLLDEKQKQNEKNIREIEHTHEKKLTEKEEKIKQLQE
jgi:hypothetical protein